MLLADASILSPRYACMHSNPAELWPLTKPETTISTITGLPLRCNSNALQYSMGMPSVSSTIQQRQLIFIHSFSVLPSNSPSPSILYLRTTSRGIIPTLKELILKNNLPTPSSTITQVGMEKIRETNTGKVIFQLPERLLSSTTLRMRTYQALQTHPTLVGDTR